MIQNMKNLYGKTVGFIAEVKVEMKKVSWPNRSEVRGATIVVIILVLLISLLIGLFDAALGYLADLIYS